MTTTRDPSTHTSVPDRNGPERDPDPVCSAATATLRRTIWRWGLVSLVAYALQIPLSFAFAPFAPRGAEQPREEMVLSGAVSRLPFLSPAAEAALTHLVTGESSLRVRAVRAVAFALPATAATVSFVLVLLALLRNVAAVDRSVVAVLLRIALVTAALRLFAYPVFTQDFWYSVAWGRMLVEGANPYLQNFTPSSLAGLPVAWFEQRMTYGPLWATISMGLSAVAAHNVLAEYFLFKSLLAGSWVLTLLLVRSIAATRSSFHAAMAVCIFGWIPASSQLSIAEGHNDVVMVLFMTMWLYLLVARSDWSPVALAASVLVKYVTAPFIAVELLHSVPRVRSRPGRYLVALGACALLAGVLFAPFVRSGNPLAATVAMASWDFWTPALAISTAAEKLGLPIRLSIANGMVAAACAALVIRYLLAYLRTRSLDALVEVLLASMMGILFLLVGHVWPWFLLWIAPLAALAWDGLPARILISALLAVPLLNSHWILARTWGSIPDMGLVFYGVVAVLAVVAGRFVLRPFQRNQGKSPSVLSPSVPGGS